MYAFCCATSHDDCWLTRRDADHMTSIGLLPDNVLLEIFDFYVADKDPATKTKTEGWQILIHVCRRWRVWRHIFFFWITASPGSATVLYSQHTCKGQTGHL